jgi:hypothetical protein
MVKDYIKKKQERKTRPPKEKQQGSPARGKGRNSDGTIFHLQGEASSRLVVFF